jgi:TonB-dependent receptor
MLNGIQVSKTITPDMDANAIGGVVNFDLREAQQDELGDYKYGFWLQGGYNGLENAQNKFGNYKILGNLENRFFDNKLGALVQASFERRNLSSNELAAEYGPAGNSETDYLTRNITLDDVYRDRERVNAVLALDYQLPDGAIKFSNFFSTSTTEITDRQQFYNVETGQNTSNFTSIYGKNTLNNITNILNYTQKAWIFDVNAILSHSFSETKNPKDWTVTFTTSPAGLTQFGNARNVDPKEVLNAATHDTNATIMRTLETRYGYTKEQIFSAALDFNTPLYFSNDISAMIKFGGKYEYRDRKKDIDVTNGNDFGLASGAQIIDQLKAEFPWFTDLGDGLRVSMSPFMDRNFDYGTFLGGEYEMIYPQDFSRMQEMMDFVYGNQIPGNISYSHNIGSSLTNDYWGEEHISAAYIMATINFGQTLSITPGVRYQQLKTTYTGVQGLQGPNSGSDYEHQLVTHTAYHPYWLPDVLVRFKPLDWFDVRLSYTNTLSYPDYNALSPRINVFSSAGELQWNGFQLDPIRSTNYDVYLSFYDNTIGLFTAGAFLKQITDLIYEYSFTPPTPEELAKYYPEWTERTPSQAGIKVFTFINNPFTIDNYGMELDWQSHFWYLPGILSGLIMNVNYTHIFSEAEYPYELTTSGFPRRYIDTSYFAPLLYQPDDILNFTIGYDYEGFSIRVSSIYSADIFTGPTQWSQLRAFSTAYNKWDASIKQELPFWHGMEVFLNLVNINSAEDKSAITAETGVPSQIQSFDYMLEFGVRGQF